MKEIGGYIEFETYEGHALHEEMTGLNCGRNCLGYLISARRITAIVLPYFLCSSVKELCEKMSLRIRYYRVGESFGPENVALKSDEWLYVVNYYGQLTRDDIARIKAQYGRVIVDNAQAYFEEPVPGTDTLYSCRKYFGVPDGAFLSTDAKLERMLPEDRSSGRMDFLLGRFEGNASDYYGRYQENNALFRKEPLKHMSHLTLNLLRAVDYDSVREKRRANFEYLEQRLGGINRLKLRIPDGAFAYPLMVRGAAWMRQELIKQRIYVPLLWPNVPEEAAAGTWDYELASSVLPLPCDQRYDRKDMEYMADMVEMLHGTRT